MDGGVAASRPAGADTKHGAVGNLADVDLARGHPGPLHLRVTAEAQVVVGLRKQHPVDGAVRVMARSAAFPQRGMLKHKRSRLLAVTLGAILVGPRHGQAPGRLENIAPVGIVALRAIQMAFEDRVVLGKFKFRAHLQMTPQAGLRFVAGIDDELPAATAGSHVHR